MKQSFLFWILLYPFISVAQNLLPNPGFEKNIDGKVTEWLQPTPATGRYHYESNNGVVDGVMVYNHYNGLCLRGPDASEYMLVKLKHKLTKGRTYCAKMDVIIAGDFVGIKDLKSVEWKFVVTPPPVDFLHKYYGPADIIFPLQISRPDEKNKRLEANYTARGDEEYLVIGKFFSYEKDADRKAMLAEMMYIDRARDSVLKLVSDTFLLHYPPLVDPSLRGKKARVANEAFLVAVETTNQLKIEVMEMIYSTYGRRSDSLTQALGSYNYWMRTYFDNMCLSLIENNNCNCDDTELAQMVGNFIRGNTYRFEKVNFKPGESVLNDTAKAELSGLAQTLKKYPNTNLKLSGHTDNVADETLNLTLSKARAKACIDYLISLGISKNRLTSEGFGSSKPLADNESEEGRAMNRRVDFVIK